MFGLEEKLQDEIEELKSQIADKNRVIERLDRNISGLEAENMALKALLKMREKEIMKMREKIMNLKALNHEFKRT